MFIEAWRKVAPTVEPPKIPLSLKLPRPLPPGSIPSKLTLNFYLPSSAHHADKEVDMVIVPATTGQMGILPGQLATMTELRPGVVSLHQGTQTTKYFVSGGFAFVHPNSVAEIIALEAVPIERIDPSLVHKGLAEYTYRLSAATSDYERVRAQIGVDLHTALAAALTA